MTGEYIIGALISVVILWLVIFTAVRAAIHQPKPKVTQTIQPGKTWLEKEEESRR